MRKRGKVVSWKEGKGFGFIEPFTGGEHVFVHIKAFPGGSRSPAVGAEVSYVESSDPRGRARAESVKLLAAGFSLGPPAKALFAASFYLLLVAAIVALGFLPWQFLGWYLVMSTLTFAFYAMDKSAAKKGGHRTAESTLHILALVGGWPGALYAQQRLRHKSRKQPFRSIFWVTLVLNIAGLGYLISDHGAWLMEIFQDMVR